MKSGEEAFNYTSERCRFKGRNDTEKIIVLRTNDDDNQEKLEEIEEDSQEYTEKLANSLATEDSVIYEVDKNVVKYGPHSVPNFESDENVLPLVNFVGKNKLNSNGIIKKFTKNAFVLLSLAVFMFIYYVFHTEVMILAYNEELFYTNEKSTNNLSVINFIVLFHCFLLLFLFSFVRVSVMDPGRIEEEYRKEYSLSEYYIQYSEYYLSKIKEFKSSEKKTDFSPEKGAKMDIDIKSLGLKKKLKELELAREESSNDDSIIVDKDAQFVTFKVKMKDFEEKINKKKKNSKFWEYKCYNFTSKNIFDNTCRICHIIRPERAYHCKQCRSCIQKLDHHCTFVNNCIGFHSYKIFLNMLMYLVVTLSLMVYFEVKYFHLILWNNSNNYFLLVVFFMILTQISILILVTVFFGYHIKIISKGYTQYEDLFFIPNYEKEYFSFISKMSVFKKFMIVFGTNPLYWFLPFKPSNNENGYYFRSLYL